MQQLFDNLGFRGGRAALGAIFGRNAKPSPFGPGVLLPEQQHEQDE